MLASWKDNFYKEPFQFWKSHLRRIKDFCSFLCNTKIHYDSSDVIQGNNKPLNAYLLIWLNYSSPINLVWFGDIVVPIHDITLPQCPVIFSAKYIILPGMTNFIRFEQGRSKSIGIHVYEWSLKNTAKKKQQQEDSHFPQSNRKWANRYVNSVLNCACILNSRIITATPIPPVSRVCGSRRHASFLFTKV